MNLVTTIEIIGVIVIFVLLYYFLKLMFSFLFSDKPIKESNQSISQPVDASYRGTVLDIKERVVYRTRPYKRYSYDGGAVKGLPRMELGGLKS